MKKKKRNKPNAKAAIQTAAPKISVCLIAKNEEKHIDRCLNSIKEIADEIIFVDTGSTDQTADIAKKYTDKIYFHPWNDNFSEARNHSIEYATGDWILIIDADEELVKEGIPVIRKAVQDQTIDAVMVEIASRMRNGRGESFHCVERIFRNNGRIHYEGRVHNCLVGITNAKIFPIRLIHYGYDLDAESSQKKFDRTVSLLKKDLEDDPGNPMTYHYLGCSYLFQGMFEQSYEASKKAIELSSARKDPNLIYLWSHYNAAASCHKLKNLAEAEAISLSALKQYPNHVDSHFMLSLVYFDWQQWAKLIFHGREYIRLSQLQQKSPQTFGNFVTVSLKEEGNIGTLVGIAYAELGDRKKAEEMFQKAMDLAPEPFRVPRAAGIFFHKKGLLNEARSYLLKADRLNRGDQTVRQLLDEIDNKIGYPAKEPRISLCMIVKNEEDCLNRCLDSVKDFVDEIIVVDTGSTDRTVEIAESYGARIYHHPWENDFSKHRNQSISYATGDWILIMDADEELDAKTSPMIKTLVRNAGTGVITFNVRSYLEDGAYYTEGSSPRLFKNGLGIHYRGRVHNQIIFKETPTPSPVVLWHYGYDLDPEKKTAKVERSLTLLRQQAAEWPDDIPTRHHLAMTLMANKEWEEAYQEAALTLEMAKTREERSSQLAWTYFVATTCLIKLERFEEADAICQEGLERFDWSIDLHHCLTQINFVKKDYEKVLKHGAAFLDRCEKLTANFGAFPLFQFETAHRDWVIYRSMGYAHIYFGRLEQGIELLEKAVENVSKHERFQLLEEIGMNLLKIGQKEKAIGLLEMLPIEQASLANGCRALAMAYEDSGRKQEAVDVYQKLKDALPEDPEIPFRMGLLLLELHDYASASEAFEVAAGKAPDHAEAFINWGLALKKQGFYEQAEGKYLHALHMAPENPTAAQNLGLLLLQQSRYPEALPLLQRSLAADPTDTAVALALSRASLETGDIEGMIKPCEFLLRSLDLPSDSTLESLSDLADLYLMIAGGLLTKGQVQAFEMAVDIGLRLGPGSTVIIAGLIHASLDKGEQGIALRLLKAGLLLNPVDEHLTSLGQPLRCIR